MRVAILNAKGVLIGAKEKKNPGAKDIDCGDLPANGRYRWDTERQMFIPVNFGKGKVKAPDVTKDQALYLFMKAVIDSTPIPQECRDWCEWYERYHD